MYVSIQQSRPPTPDLSRVYSLCARYGPNCSRITVISGSFTYVAQLTPSEIERVQGAAAPQISGQKPAHTLAELRLNAK